MNEEVDFYVSSDGLGVQVAYSLSNDKILEREVTEIEIELNQRSKWKTRYVAMTV